MKIKPLADRVLIKVVDETTEKTAGGLYIPQTAQEKTQTGVVEAIGSDETITVKVGDKVMYDKYAGTTIKTNNEEKLLVRMSDILAVIS
jgi:chaperonin GroES